MQIAYSTRVIRRNSLGQFIADCEASARETIEEAVTDGAKLSKGFAPKRTGELKGSIEPIVLSRTSGMWRATAKHALPQETGASGHPIVGKPHLAFFWEKEGRYFTPAAYGPGGTPDTVTIVNHPGNPAHPYLKPAYNLIMGRLAAIAARMYPG